MRLSDGTAPIGRGIGPALEARDVVAVLRNENGAPSDLRDKALTFASAILRFDPAMPELNATAKAAELLDSGAAWETFERIRALQGPPPERVEVGMHVAEIEAGEDGTVDSIDCFTLADIARAAGAPADKGAGIDILTATGTPVSRGSAIYRIHARNEESLAKAAARAAADHAFKISTL